MGTVDYMAPEQALNTKHADAQSDIYSLGCTLHYLLVGKAPYAGETLMEKLLAHRELPIPDLGAAGIVRAELQTIFELMIAKSPADRYPSMGDAARALAECRAQLSEPSIARAAATTSSGPVSALTFLRDVSLAPRRAAARSSQTKAGVAKASGKLAADQSVSASRWLRIVTLAAGLIVLGVGGFASWRAWRAPAAQDVASVPSAAERNLAKPLDSLDPANIPATERYDWQPKELVAVMGERRGAHGPGFYPGLPNQAVVMSPDGSQVASITQALHGFMLWDAKTLRPVKAFGPSTGHLATLVYAPDGKRLALVAGGVQFWNLAGAEPVEERKVNWGVLSHCDFDPEGTCVAVSAGDEIKLCELKSGEYSPLATWKNPSQSEVTALKFFPGGKLLASLDKLGQLHLWDLLTNPPALAGEYRSHDGTGTAALAISPDGKTLASSGNSKSKSIRLWDVRPKGLKSREDLPTTHEPFELGFAMNGTRLVAGVNGPVPVWNIEGAKARKTAELSTDGAMTLGLARDGKTLATIGWWQRVRLWDLAQEQPVELFPPVGHLGWVNCVAFSPDGRHLASGGGDQTIRLWDLSGTAPKEEAVLKEEPGDVVRVRFSPNGKSLVAQHSGRTLLWDLSGRQPDFTTIDGINGWPIGYSFDAKSELSSAVTIDGSLLKVWSVSDGDRAKEKANFAGAAELLGSDVSPDGKLLACSRDQVQILDISGVEVQELRRIDHNKAMSSFSADSQSLVTLGDGRLCIWDLANLDESPQSLPNVPAWNWTALVRTPNGRYVFAADQLGRIAAWDTVLGKRIAQPGRTSLTDRVLWQMPGMVRQLIVSADGHYLASANSDGSVYILRLDPTYTATIPDEK
jgi:WD40 repeat protein